MRVLWFPNKDTLGPRQQHSFESEVTGNWIFSLEEQIKKINNIELAVAFHRNKNKELRVEEFESVRYYVLPSLYTSKIGNLYNKWFGKVDNAYEIDYYFKVIELFKPDVIHIFGFENSFIKILPLYSDKVIIHIQGIQNVVSFFLKGHFTLKELSTNISIFDRFKGNSFRKFVRHFHERSVIESSAFLHCKYLFGRTEWDRRVALAVAPQAKYIYCQEIMRPEFYQSKWNKYRSEQIIIYTTLRDLPYKGPDQIFIVDKILQSYHPSLNYIWRIAGIAEDNVFVRIMRKRGFEKNNRIQFLGNLSAHEIIDEMQNCDIFVYPSFIENSSNAVQEAMLVGLPIVCTSAGGLTTIIRNKETGLLVQPGDPYAMTGAILELISNFELAKEMGENARKIALKRHDIEYIVSTIILGAYEEIFNRNRRMP